METLHISCQRYRWNFLTGRYQMKFDKILFGWLLWNIQEITGHDGDSINNYDLKDDFIGLGVDPRQSNFVINPRRIPNRKKSMKSFILFWSSQNKEGRQTCQLIKDKLWFSQGLLKAL